MLFMGGFDTLGHLNGNSDGLLYVQMAFFHDIALQGNPFHQLHDNKVDVALVHNVIDIHNVRVGKAGRRLGLHFKLADKSGVRCKFRLQYLNGHQSV